MKKLLFLLLFPISFFGQTCTYPFANTVKDIVETNDGNFVFCSGDFKTTNSTNLSLADYPRGVYLLKVTYGLIVEEVKVIKE